MTARLPALDPLSQILTKKIPMVFQSDLQRSPFKGNLVTHNRQEDFVLQMGVSLAPAITATMKEFIWEGTALLPDIKYDISQLN